MKRTLIILMTLGLHIVANASDAGLDSLYNAIDEAIAHADTYLQQKNTKIKYTRDQYNAARDLATRYHYAHNLYEEYQAFMNDSAIHYLNLCIGYARQMNREDLLTNSYVDLGYQYSSSGFYNEALHYFQLVPQAQLGGKAREHYYIGISHLYGEMAYYSKDKKLSEQYNTKAQEYLDSLFTIADPGSVSYLWRKQMQCINENKATEALRLSDQWRKLVKPETREYAIWSYFRSEAYKILPDVEQQKYWLAHSALSDIKCAVMDQSALWTLADVINRVDGDTERSYQYMNFSWQCISRFSTHMRGWIISPILTLINDNYKSKLKTANQQLLWLTGLISLLLLVMILLLLNVLKQKKELTVARNDLKATNEELASLNAQLSETNSQMASANSQLYESNRVKDEYIGKFLSLCSEYIDKLDNYRIKINRKVKANQYADILKMTNSEQLKEDELKELFENFDSVFLHLFPNFVEDFNALMKDGYKIVPPDEHQLTTDLRIFALIRLGIEESSKIADFLRYSPNSIYNYRARIKSKAVCGRDEFERRVKEIGMRN